MPEPISDNLIEVIRDIESVLIEGQYADDAPFLRSSRLNASDIRTVLKEHGTNVTRSPNEAIGKLFVIRIKNVEPPSWHVDFDLWIDNKPSDLTLSLTIETTHSGKLLAHIEDLHVL